MTWEEMSAPFFAITVDKSVDPCATCALQADCGVAETEL